MEESTYKPGALITLLIVALLCEIGIPAIAIGMAIARHNTIDATGRQIAIVIIAVELCAITTNVIALVHLRARKRSAKAFAWAGMAGLLPLALLGILLAVGIGRMLVSPELSNYLTE